MLESNMNIIIISTFNQTMMKLLLTRIIVVSVYQQLLYLLNHMNGTESQFNYSFEKVWFKKSKTIEHLLSWTLHLKMKIHRFSAISSKKKKRYLETNKKARHNMWDDPELISKDLVYTHF